MRLAPTAAVLASSLDDTFVAYVEVVEARDDDRVVCSLKRKWLKWYEAELSCPSIRYRLNPDGAPAEIEWTFIGAAMTGSDGYEKTFLQRLRKLYVHGVDSSPSFQCEEDDGPGCGVWNVTDTPHLDIDRIRQGLLNVREGVPGTKNGWHEVWKTTARFDSLRGLFQSSVQRDRPMRPEDFRAELDLQLDSLRENIMAERRTYVKRGQQKSFRDLTASFVLVSEYADRGGVLNDKDFDRFYRDYARVDSLFGVDLRNEQSEDPEYKKNIQDRNLVFFHWRFSSWLSTMSGRSQYNRLHSPIQKRVGANSLIYKEYLRAAALSGEWKNLGQGPGTWSKLVARGLSPDEEGPALPSELVVVLQPVGCVRTREAPP